MINISAVSRGGLAIEGIKYGKEKTKARMGG